MEPVTDKKNGAQQKPDTYSGEKYWMDGQKGREVASIQNLNPLGEKQIIIKGVKLLK